MKLLPARLLRGREMATPMCVLWEGRADDLTMPGERRILNQIVPPWQRPEVWTQAQKASFIEGVILGLGAGYYVVNGTDYDPNEEARGRVQSKPMSGWLLDGQQRITAVRDFISDGLPIFDGLRYSNLSVPEQRLRFDNVVFTRVQLDYCDDEDKLKELYRRLNFGGTSHTQDDLERVQNTDSTGIVPRPRGT